jgi:hypothetical protein
MRYSDPAWIGRLKTGSDLNLASTLLLLTGGGVHLAISESPEHPAIDPRIPASVVVIGLALSVLANWLITLPDPGGLGEKSYGASRHLVRWTLFALTGSIAYVIGDMVLLLPPVHQWYFRLLADLCGAINLIGLIALLQYLSRLAVRMRDARLSERCRTLRVGYALAGGLSLLVVFLHDFLLPTDYARDNDLGGLVLALAAVAALSSLVVLFMWVLMLLRLSASLTEQRRLAIPLWNEGVA